MFLANYLYIVQWRYIYGFYFPLKLHRLSRRPKRVTYPRIIQKRYRTLFFRPFPHLYPFSLSVQQQLVRRRSFSTGQPRGRLYCNHHDVGKHDPCPNTTVEHGIRAEVNIIFPWFFFFFLSFNFSTALSATDKISE